MTIDPVIKESTSEKERDLIAIYLENEQNAKRTRENILNATAGVFPKKVMENMLIELENFGSIRGGLQGALGVECKSTVIDARNRAELLLEMV